MQKQLTIVHVYARKLHRFLVLIISVLTIIMIITGGIMKYPDIASAIVPSVNFERIREVHSNISTYFSITLVLMALTGIIMYLYPTVIKWFKPQKPVQN